MLPQTVNAEYDPSDNSITFPAGILQPPIYDPAAPAMQNLGGLGMIIAHEITHAFDSSGAHYDAQGRHSELVDLYGLAGLCEAPAEDRTVLRTLSPAGWQQG
jgi:hypothetical protein